MPGEAGAAGRAGEVGAGRHSGRMKEDDKAEGAGSAARRTRNRPAVQRVARAGLVARAVAYLLLAYLTGKLAGHSPSGHRVDSTGVLVSLVRQPAGPELVALLGIGFLVYAGWRVLQAAGGDPGVDGGQKLVKRAGWAAVAIGYLGVCAEAAAVSIQGHSSKPSSSSEAARVLAVAGGRELLFTLGAGIVVGGAGLMVWAVLQRFMIALPRRRLPPWAEPAVHVLGTLAGVVRGAVFASVGVTLAVAAVAARPADAKGLSAALHALTGQPFGTPLLAVTAAGFVAFAILSILEAAYRDM